MAVIPGNGRGINPSNLAGNPATYTGIVIAEAEGVMSLGEGCGGVLSRGCPVESAAVEHDYGVAQR